MSAPSLPPPAEPGSGDGACAESLFSPSIPLCIALSAFGGLLEVSSTMCLAYPEHKAKLGTVYSKCQQRLHMVVNLLLMGVASVAYIIGSWFGPVSLSVPTVMVSKLLFNLIIIGVILRMDTFSKNQRVGTYCIACAILTLPDVGPGEQECQDIIRMIQEPMAIIWTIVLFFFSIFCCVMMVVLKRRTDAGNPPGQNLSLLVYVTAQVCSAVIGTSVSKMFAADVPPLFLYTLFLLAIIFAAINVISLILAATAVDQGIFVPMQTCATLVINLITGLVVWEDYKVVDKWIAYIMVHCIMMLGIWLLSPEDAIQQYKGAKQFHPDTIKGETPEAQVIRASQAGPVEPGMITAAWSGEPGHISDREYPPPPPVDSDELAWRATSCRSFNGNAVRASMGMTAPSPTAMGRKGQSAMEFGGNSANVRIDGDPTATIPGGNVRGRAESRQRNPSFAGTMTDRVRQISTAGLANLDHETKGAWRDTFSTGTPIGPGGARRFSHQPNDGIQLHVGNNNALHGVPPPGGDPSSSSPRGAAGQLGVGCPPLREESRDPSAEGTSRHGSMAVTAPPAAAPDASLEPTVSFGVTPKV